MTVFSVLRNAFLPPAKVGEGSVGFSNLMHLMFLLDGVALHDVSCHQFLGKLFMHLCASVFVVPALREQPLHSQEATPVV